MVESQDSFKELFELLLDYHDDSVYLDVLEPWIRNNRMERDWLSGFAERSGNPIPDAATEDLWKLYALSRVADLLLLGLPAPIAVAAPRQGPSILLGEFAKFFEALGFIASFPSAYSPFHHEIVSLQSAAEEQEPVRILGHVWPCLMLGPMLFLRAGVRVSAGTKILAPGVADSSTLYWTYYRKTRPTHDLSLDWGSNSQWRTSFRRDYKFNGKYFFNVDGALDISAARSLPNEYDSLTRMQGCELLVNRCFTTSTVQHEHRNPYSYYLCTESPTSLSEPAPSLFARLLPVLAKLRR